ncbi:MAG TPA: glycerol kinase GlpK [Sphingomicrobium sp.]
MAADHILAIDQGTTSTRAIPFDREARPVSSAQRELTQHYPRPGWVEHDPEEIWQSALATAREAIAAVDASRIAGIGITNQRETAVVWDRATGEPIYPAIVWQDRRTADACAKLKAEGAEPLVQSKTGLLLDPYFSATKVAWILDNVPGARTRAEKGELAFGTVDSFLLWRLTGGAVHATDITNASRTMVYDIRQQRWDGELCRLFGVPEAILPQVRDNSGMFGLTAPGLFERQLPISGMAGDQQAALFGQRCFEPGMVKSTYGTGCFMLLNTGDEAVRSNNRLLTTPAYRIGGSTHYALEGAIFVAGASIKWLRDSLDIIAEASAAEGMARRVPDDHGVYLVPAFVGLGAPHWEPGARGAIHGLTFDCGRDHLVRAALEAVAYQSLDLMGAMAADSGAATRSMRVDGGMAANDWLCQFLADILAVPVERPANLETTAIGAAFLAGLATGVWAGIEALPGDEAHLSGFEPRMADAERQRRIEGWKDAVRRTLPLRPS